MLPWAVADVTVAFGSVAKFGKIITNGLEGRDDGMQDSHKRPVLETKTSSYRNVRSKRGEKKPSIKSRHSDVTRGFGEAHGVCGK